VDWNRKHTDRTRVLLEIMLPDDFPAKYDKSIGKAIDSCLVAKLGKGIDPASFKNVISRKKVVKDKTLVSGRQLPPG